MSDGDSTMDRRTVLKLIAAAAAAPSVFACETPDAADPAAPSSPSSNPLAAGTPFDPDLLDPVVPWERSLTEPELETLAALCDLIIPADERSPAASALGAHEFIDEWVSAPYEAMERDKVLVRGGIVWLDAESNRRFGARFVELTGSQQSAICDDICYGEEAEPEFRSASRFVDKVRDLTATAFYTTREGMQDLGYVGNVPLAQWDPPPPEALRHVGLES
ncbi:MAG TPA: gluconate 2-dehydrogenase subunit 3 family protein [Gemmatimonadota bacterium]|nr:gluconate 2-dehydrogenase subunit 3 family protein [Gemmatimonadota bacterium]